MKISSLAIIVLLLVSWVLYQKRQLTQRKLQLISTPEATPVQQLDPKPQLPKKCLLKCTTRGYSILPKQITLHNLHLNGQMLVKKYRRLKSIHLSSTPNFKLPFNKKIYFVSPRTHLTRLFRQPNPLHHLHYRRWRRSREKANGKRHCKV